MSDTNSHGGEIFCILDARGYDIPTITGPFHSDAAARDYVVGSFDLEADKDLPDGLQIIKLETSYVDEEQKQ